MPRLALQTLTWATITAAIGSALWLASANLGWADLRKGADLASGVTSLQLPKEATGAGKPAAGASTELHDTASAVPQAGAAQH